MRTTFKPSAGFHDCFLCGIVPTSRPVRTVSRNMHRTSLRLCRDCVALFARSWLTSAELELVQLSGPGT